MIKYHKNKYTKKINLFSKDAVKSLDSSGLKYDTFVWNNITDLRLNGNCKMKIGSLDFDTGYSSALTQDIIAPVPPDNLICNFKFENDFLDDTGFCTLTDNLIGTNSFSDTVVKKGDYSCLFNNVEFVLAHNVRDNNVLEGLSNFSFSYWVNFTSTTTTQHFVRQNYCIIIRTQTGNIIEVYLNNNDNWTRYYTFPYVITTNKWVHWSLTFDLITSTVKFYIDGVEVSGGIKYGTWDFTTYPNTTETFNFGKNAGATALYGYQDDFRIYDKTLSSDEVNRIIAEVQKDPILHYKFDDDDIDDTGNTILNTNRVPVYSEDNKIGSHSINITQGDEFYITKNGTNDIINNISQFSICFWIKWNNTTQAIQHIVQQEASFLIRKSSTTQLQVAFYNGTTWRDVYYNYNASSYGGKYHHFSYIVDFNETGNNIYKLFINGINIPVATADVDAMPNLLTSTSQFNVFFGGTYSNDMVDGNIDDFRIYDKALDANELREIMWDNRGLYMWYNFEPSYIEPGNEIVHYNFNNNLNDITENTYLTKVYGPVASFYDTIFRKGTHSIKSDLTIYDLDDKNYLDGETKLSISCWLQFHTINANQILLYKRDSILLMWHDALQKMYIQLGDNNSNYYTFNFDLSGNLNKWVHLIFTVDFNLSDNHCTMFLNGVEATRQKVGTGINTTVFEPSIYNLGIFGNNDVLNGGGLLEAYVDDFRIYDKVLTQTEITDAYNNYIFFNDSMRNTLLTNEFDAGLGISSIKKLGHYSLDLTGGIRGGSISQSDGNTNIFENLNRISILLWVYLSGTNTTSHYILYQDTTFSIKLDVINNKFVVNLGNQIMTWTLNLTNITNVWKHISIVLDYTETDSYKKVMLYIDGISQGIGTKTGSDNTDVSFPATTNKLFIGSYDGTQIGFNGLIDDLRIYSFEIDPDDILIIMNPSTPSIYNIRCDNVYDTYDSDNKKPLIYHNRGTLRNKHIINPYFKINTPLNKLTLKITNYINSMFDEYGLEPSDNFIISLIIEEDDKKETTHGNKIEDYHRSPQFRIKY